MLLEPRFVLKDIREPVVPSGLDSIQLILQFVKKKVLENEPFIKSNSKSNLRKYNSKRGAEF